MLENGMSLKRAPGPDDKMARDAENVDDWLFRSIKDYSSLHMYELQHPPACLQCISPSAVMVATQQSNGLSELMELRLPGKLMTEGPNKGLCSDRDFKLVSGGVHDKHITQLATSKDNGYVVCAEKCSSAITVWRLGNSKTDLLRKVHSINPDMQTDKCCRGSRVAASGVQCVYGPTVGELWLADAHTGKNIQKFDHSGDNKSIPVSTLDFTDKNTCIVCTKTGQLLQLDTRTKNAPTEMYKACSESQEWTCCCDDSGAYLLSSDSTIIEVDLKNAKTEKQSRHLGLKSVTPDLIQIKKSPAAESIVSVSGLDNNIHIYDLKTPSQSLSPLFTHIGHWAEVDGTENQRPEVLCHAWHPTIPKLLLSAATDGSLHAWQYLEES